MTTRVALIIGGAIVLAAVLVAGMIWLVGTDDRAVPASPSTSVAAPSTAQPWVHDGVVYPSGSCTEWRAVQPDLNAVPVPPADWTPATPAGREAFDAWESALRPILARLSERTKHRDPATGLLRTYVDRQEDAITAAQSAVEGTGTYGPATVSAVQAAMAQLDAVCGP
ncbi:hypothetical protein [Mycobacterium sp. 1274756.6]|uniref:hypothetical protein n=1 Tax=Mycobacterium sp. 1274756.6 TaxID=1834076 RepID=UPI0007FF2344|nr:hypothetical protein [Mycobacterium sp. 1274756.6]OBJ73861.1 hypothetical protein A5643_00285 [Mycobacterium sp. 1274756.6]